MTASVYARALGDDFGMLHPELQRWFGSTAEVRARGVFVEAGSRLRWLRPAWNVAARLGLLFPEYGRAVPFEATMAPAGVSTVATRRVLRFESGERVLADTTRVVRGRLVDAHAHGRLQVEMLPNVVDGTLVARSGRARLMLARRVPMPVPSPRVELRHAWDADAGRHTIDVAVLVPVLGEVFGYHGHFSAE
jgi:hypothetical protein